MLVIESWEKKSDNTIEHKITCPICQKRVWAELFSSHMFEMHDGEGEQE